MAIMLALLILKVNGQPKQLDTARDGFWFKWVKEKARKMKLPDMAACNDTFHMRLWGLGGVVLDCIDIYGSPDSDLRATISFYTEEQVPATEAPTYRAFSKKTNLPKGAALKIYGLLKADSIIDMPSEEKIKGWEQGLDGNEYLVEYSTPDIYACRSYWTPAAQKELREAKLILDCFEKLNTIPGIKQIAVSFDHEIPFESYWAGGMYVKIRWKETSAQRKKYKKERDLYRKSLHLN